MLHRISTPILVAILIYHGYHYFNQWKLQRHLDEYRTHKLAQKEHNRKQRAPDIVKKPEITKVSDSVYVAQGYAFANSVLLVGPTGVVVVDTTENENSAKLIQAEFRKITQKPLVGIIYTHNHFDHVAGTSGFFDNGTRPDGLEIWAHHTLMAQYTHSMRVMGEAHYRRAMRQFGGFLDQRDTSKRGFNTKLKVKPNFIVPPNRFVYKPAEDVHIGGMHVRLYHVPGETNDQIAVYWPDQKVLLCGDDFYKAFPNLYAIRGTTFRSLKVWYESLDLMRSIRAHVLVSGHTTPVYGEEEVYRSLTDYRDAVQFVHDQTVRYINKGMHPDDIVRRVRLPEKLAKKPYLEELYGTVAWSAKGLFAGYMGWFSGDIVELEPHSPDEQAERLTKLAGGVKKLLDAAREYLDSDDPQWALRLSSAALRVEPHNQDAREIKAKSLYELSAQQTSMNGANYYAMVAKETLGEIDIKIDAQLKKEFAKTAKMREIFDKMALRMKGEECPDTDKVVSFDFPDTKQKIQFHMRNGIVEIGESFGREVDVKVVVNSVVWRELVAGDRNRLLTAVTSQLSVEPGLLSLQEVMGCFDKDD